VGLLEGKFRADLYRQDSVQQVLIHNAPRLCALMNGFTRSNEFDWARKRDFVLHIHRIQCSDLMVADHALTGGKSDPYVYAAAFSLNEPYAHEDTMWKSPVIKKTLNPCWTESGSDLSPRGR
jgi:C2 domain